MESQRNILDGVIQIQRGRNVDGFANRRVIFQQKFRDTRNFIVWDVNAGNEHSFNANRRNVGILRGVSTGGNDARRVAAEHPLNIFHDFGRNANQPKILLRRQIGDGFSRRSGSAEKRLNLAGVQSLGRFCERKIARVQHLNRQAVRQQNFFSVLQDAGFFFADRNFPAQQIGDAPNRRIFRHDNLTGFGVKTGNGGVTLRGTGGNKNSNASYGVGENIALNNRHVQKTFAQEPQIGDGTGGRADVELVILVGVMQHFGEPRVVRVVRASLVAGAEIYFIGTFTAARRENSQQQRQQKNFIHGAEIPFALLTIRARCSARYWKLGRSLKSASSVSFAASLLKIFPLRLISSSRAKNSLDLA